MISASAIASSENNLSIYDVFRQGQSEKINPINLTLGNPNLKPPPIYYKVMREVIQELEDSEWNGHGYMVEDDPFGLCGKIAKKLSHTYQTSFDERDVCMTVGATGALDVILKTILNNGHHHSPSKPQNEVIIIAPYFVEYTNLIEGNGGTPVIVHSDKTFGIDCLAIERAITPRTKAILVNSPNNPTGRVYTQEELALFAKMLKNKNDTLGISIQVIEDAVYNTILFNQDVAPSLIQHYPFLYHVNSYSKSMSISGERIGYLAVHPEMGDELFRKELGNSLHLNMRMRVVHAPLLQHRILARLPANCVTNIDYYKHNIETLYACLTKLGFIVGKPQGTFYIWAVLPERYIGEDKFRRVAQQGNAPLLYLPGFLFGGIKYANCIRFSACVSYETMVRACERLIEIDANF